jgi:hypothetical protein
MATPAGDRLTANSPPPALPTLPPGPLAPSKPLSPLPETNKLTPMSFRARRLISENRTSSMTCCDEPIASKLTTLPGA